MMGTMAAFKRAAWLFSLCILTSQTIASLAFAEVNPVRWKVKGLYMQCKNIEKLDNTGDLSDKELLELRECFGYINGIYDMMVQACWHQLEHDDSIPNEMMAKEDHTPGALVHAFLNWASKYPETWHFDRSFVRHAISQTFPCER